MDDFIREQIELAGSPHWPTVTTRIVAACWPAGTADRAEPMALGWVSRWRPAHAVFALPVCTCPQGHCALCN